MSKTETEAGTRAGTSEPLALTESALDAIAGGGHSQCEGDDGSGSGGSGSGGGASKPSAICHGVTVLAYARVDG